MTKAQEWIQDHMDCGSDQKARNKIIDEGNRLYAEDEQEAEFNRVLFAYSAEGMAVDRKVIISQAGGNASKGAKGYKISLPAAMIREIGITPDDRAVTVRVENGKIIIEKKRDGQI